jgi:hypothetical protein
MAEPLPITSPCHLQARHPRSIASLSCELNLRKTHREDGENCGGLQLMKAAKLSIIGWGSMIHHQWTPF